jgi:hypothetical protein
MQPLFWRNSRTGTTAEDRGLEHDPEKACAGLDPGWTPVFGKACPGRDPGIMLKQQAKAKCRIYSKIISL